MRKELATKLVRVGFMAQMSSIFLTILLSTTTLIYAVLYALDWNADVTPRDAFVAGLVAVGAIFAIFWLGYIIEHLGEWLSRVRIVSRETAE